MQRDASTFLPSPAAGLISPGNAQHKPLGNDSTPTVNSTNEIYSNPDFWTEEKLTQNYWRFSNIATTFGITHVQETKDDLYLHCLDIDSDNVLSILFDLLNELKSRTFKLSIRFPINI